MKQLSFLLAAFILLQQAGAQTVNPFPKTITVSGSAEMEVIPDEIYVQVDLREYDKKASAKVSIDKIKSDFLQNLRRLGIPDSAISIASYEGYNGYQWWRRKKRENEMFASIAYQIKLNNSYKVDEIVNILDDDATHNFQIIRTSHSKILEYRKQLKILAVKAARDKANYLTEAINEKAGEAVTIHEPNDVSLYYYTPKGYMESSKLANYNVRAETAQTADQATIDFKKIKLKFDVSVVFALK